MTQIFPFVPSSVTPFSFSPVLDGATYNATVPWGLFGARYYLNLVALDGTLIWYGAIVGSGSGISIQSMTWANGIVAVTTAVPHGYKPATTVELTITGCTPDAYNGLYPCLITGPSSFSYLLASDPGSSTVFGIASYDVSMIGGVQKEDGTYFQSTLLFRTQSQNFEASP